VKDAEQAIEIGRANRIGFAPVARAYERIGAARFKQQRLDEALAAYTSSLGEHRTAGVLKKKQVVERALVEAQKKAYGMFLFVVVLLLAFVC
jgi:hypothetical protein